MNLTRCTAQCINAILSVAWSDLTRERRKKRGRYLDGKLTAFVILLVFVASAVCSPRSVNAGEDLVVDVVPSGWISADGKLPRGGSAKEVRAFVFPSLQGTDEANGAIVFTTPTDFFQGNNRFPRQKEISFYWPDRAKPSVSISAKRADGMPARATFSIGRDSATELRRLNWKEFRKVQERFKAWLLGKSGCWLLCDREKRFIDLDKTLVTFWASNVLSEADFSKFAAQYINPPTEFEVTYSGCQKDPQGITPSGCQPDLQGAHMWVTPIMPREELAITWGTTSIYPYPGDDAILAGVSRASVGGRTDLEVMNADGGLALFPPGTQKMASKPEKFAGVNEKLVRLPFPRKWASLFGKIFEPIYVPLDLHSDSLLRSSDGEGTAPTFLFLFSPMQYIKADPDQQGDKEIAQFTTDARTNGADKDEALQLTRRYMIVGTKDDSLESVTHELNRLLETASKGAAGSADRGFVMGVFANQTSVEVRRHININGRFLENPKPRLETWRAVISSSMSALFLTSTVSGSAPTLEVHRTVCERDGTPIRRMTIRFHTIQESVLDAARIGEGDEFDAGSHLSEAVRKQ